jgi:hypothetical protein
LIPSRVPAAAASTSPDRFLPSSTLEDAATTDVERSGTMPPLFCYREVVRRLLGAETA